MLCRVAIAELDTAGTELDTVCRGSLRSTRQRQRYMSEQRSLLLLVHFQSYVQSLIGEPAGEPSPSLLDQCYAEMQRGCFDRTSHWECLVMGLVRGMSFAMFGQLYDERGKATIGFCANWCC